MINIGVLVSGTGTNLRAILDAISAGKLDARVALVISNKPDVLALERAKEAKVPALCIPHKDFGSREEFDAALVTALREARVQWVVLAGFMRLLTSEFLNAFKNRVINIHPAILPAFPGVNAQQQAIDYGVKITGCTVHLVDEGTDTGPIIAQRAVELGDDDDVERLRARLLKQEHALLVEVLDRVAAGAIEVVEGADGKRTKVFSRRR